MQKQNTFLGLLGSARSVAVAEELLGL